MGNQKVALVPTSLLLPRVVVCTTTSWTSLHYILYLGTVELFPVTTIHNILSIIISLVGILPEYRCREKGGTLGGFIFVLAIWSPRRSEIFSSLG